MSEGRLLIGTAGWNYPSGKGTWNGVFYPRIRPKGFDELRYYAEHFDTVEVNSTFYGQPKTEVCRRWAARTPAGFEFSIKLFQKFTHPTTRQQPRSRARPQPISTSSAAASSRSRPAENLVRCSRNFQPVSRTTNPRASTWPGCWRHFAIIQSPLS
jgi:uncharacterized protein YecE (DUF72 family)